MDERRRGSDGNGGPPRRKRWAPWTVALLAAGACVSASCSASSDSAGSPTSRRTGASDTTAVSGASSTVTSTTAAPRSGGPAVAWQVEGCADSIVSSSRIVVANCDGGVVAFDRADGRVGWEQASNDDGQATPGITADDTVVYTPFHGAEFAVAFDGDTGREVEVPTAGVRTTYTGFDAPDAEVLPDGYAYGPEGLSRGDVVIWPGIEPGPAGIGPFVHRQAGVTVVNAEDGLRVVADDGTVLLAPERGELFSGPSPVWDIGLDQAAAATADGTLYVLDLRAGRDAGPREVTPSVDS